MTSQFDRLTAALADRYTVDREIGRGGMATVYLANDVKHGRKVAIKVLHPELAAVLGGQRFLQEITVTATLQHPHILPLFDSGEADSLFYYVMPYVEGETLRERLNRERQLSLEDAIRITREVGDGLSHAHSRGVIHRDIKPENILLSEGHALIADFGIARAITDAGGERLTETGFSLGTPEYMSPEQAMAEQQVDARADIYSLGCVAYEMLTGDPPFTGSNPQRILARKIVEPPPPLRTVRDTASEVVEHAVLKALAKTPSDRFATVAQFLGALTSTAVRVERDERIPHLRTVGATLGIVMLVAISALTMLGRRGSDVPTSDAPRLVVLPFRVLGEPENEYLSDGIADEIRARLSALTGVTVIASQSALQYKNTTKPPQQIGAELDVDYILDATVSWGGMTGPRRHLRLRPQLIRTSDAANVWSDVYDEDVTEVFVVQTAIAERVVDAMGVVLLQREQRSLAVSPVENLEAYSLYQQGRFLVNQGGAEILRGLDIYQQVIALDSTYALAHSGIAAVYATLGTLGELPPQVAFPPARAAAQKALQLDSSLAEPRVTIAGVAGFYDWDWATSVAVSRRLHELFPDFTSGVHAVFQYFVEGRREKAIAEGRRIAEVDPLNAITVSILAHLLLSERRFAEADSVLRRSLNVTPVWLSYRTLGTSYTLQARYQEALAVLDTAVTMSGRHPFALSALGWSLGMSGDTVAAKAILDELMDLRRQRYVQSTALAVVASTMGRVDEAFEWLEQAYRERDAFLLYLHSATWWPPDILNDPRYEAFWARMRFP